MSGRMEDEGGRIRTRCSTLVGFAEAVGDGKGDLLQLPRQINTHFTDTVRHLEGHWGKIEDATHPGSDQLVGYGLGITGWDGHKPKLDLLLRDNFHQLRQVMDRYSFDFAPNDSGIGIKSGDEPKSLTMKAAITKQRTSQVTDAYQGDTPLAVGSQNLADCPNQFVATVTDTRMAKMPKMSQILADLGIGKAESASQLAATSSFFAFADQVLQLAQVHTQPIYDRRRYCGGALS